MIIGFFGQAESGKDTAADYLVRKHDFVKIAFADVMKRIAKEVYDFTEEQLWGPQEIKNKQDHRYPLADNGFLTPRKVLQVLGTEVGRNIYEDTWCRYTLEAAKKVLTGEYTYDRVKGLKNLTAFPWRVKPGGVVVSDVRFMNEIKCIHSFGGAVIRLRRTGKDGNFEGGIKGHASETAMQSIPDDTVDGVIEVQEGVELFQKQIDETLKSIPMLANSQLRWP